MNKSTVQSIARQAIVELSYEGWGVSSVWRRSAAISSWPKLVDNRTTTWFVDYTNRQGTFPRVYFQCEEGASEEWVKDEIKRQLITLEGRLNLQKSLLYHAKVKHPNAKAHGGSIETAHTEDSAKNLLSGDVQRAEKGIGGSGEDESENSRSRTAKSSIARAHFGIDLPNNPQAEDGRKAKSPRDAFRVARAALLKQSVSDVRTRSLNWRIMLPVMGGALGLILFFVLLFAWQPNSLTRTEEVPPAAQSDQGDVANITPAITPVTDDVHETLPLSVNDRDKAPSYLLIEKLPPAKTAGAEKSSTAAVELAATGNLKKAKKILLSAENTRSDQKSIDKALQAWIDANEEYDIKRCMALYAQTLNDYYYVRNVSRRAVEADKLNQFGQGNKALIDIDNMSVKLDPGQRTATVYLTKRYSGRKDQRETSVKQELRWLKSDRGWKIISERELY